MTIIKTCQNGWVDDIIPDTMTANTSTTATVVNTTGTPATPVKTDERSPVVEFEYPDSTTGEMKLRYLRVVEANAVHVKGYELVSPVSKIDGQFKTFSRVRLSRYGVHLISF